MIKNRGMWKQFVCHIVNEILKQTDKREWDHCSGKENPADLGTRDLTASKLQSIDLMWRGPHWLRGQNDGWPEEEIIEKMPESRDEAVVITVKVIKKVGAEIEIDIQRYSSREMLVRVTAWVQRFIQNFFEI